MIETLANGYSSESTHQELSDEYQHDRVLMIFKIICILMLWTKVTSALEGFSWFEKKSHIQMTLIVREGNFGLERVTSLTQSESGSS